jgi:hypothetical protein
VEPHSSTYLTGKNAIVCTSLGKGVKCAQDSLGYAATGDHFQTILAGLATLDSSAYGGRLASERIAGRLARCVTFHASDFLYFYELAGSTDFSPTDTATVCLDSRTGVLLRVSVHSTAGSGIFEATRFAAPSARDFSPPSASKGTRTYPYLPNP